MLNVAEKKPVLYAALMLIGMVLFSVGCASQAEDPNAVPPPSANARPAPTNPPGQGVVQGPSAIGQGGAAK